MGTDRKQFTMFFERMMDGFAYHQIILDKAGKPIDYVFLEVNDAFERMTGLKKEKIIGKKVTEVLKGIENDPADWIGTYGKVALTCEPLQFENFAQPLDKWYNISAYCPEKGYFVAIFEDITERKKAEEKLKTTLNRFYDSLANMHGSILLVSTEGCVEFANQSFCDYFNLKESPSELTEYSSKQIIEKIKKNYLHPEIQVKRINEIVLAGKPVVGEEVEMQGNRTCLRDFIPLHQDGASFSRLWYHMDITNQKKAEETLRQSEERFSKAFIASPAAVVITRFVDGRYVEVNETFLNLFEYTQSEVIGHTPTDLNIYVNPNGRKEFLEIFQKEGRIRYLEMNFKTKTGKLVPTIVSSEKISLQGEDHILTTIVDITQRKKAEDALRDSEQRWSTTLSSIGDAVIATDTDGKISFLNGVAEKLTGWTLEEANQKSIKQIFNIINEKTRQEVENPVVKVLEKGIIVGLANHTVLKRKDGFEIPIDDSGAPIKDKDGKIMGVVLVFRDITERKKTEAAIQRQADLIDLSPDAIIVRTLEGKITFWSKGAEKLYGWTKAEAIGKTTHSLFETKMLQPLENILSELKATQRWSGELVHNTKNGKKVIVQSWWLAEKTDHGEITSILESNIDLTESKTAEKEIERLASFPTLNPNPIFEVDFKGNVTYTNPAAKKLFPDLEKLGVGHPFLFGWQEAVSDFKNKTKTSSGREVKVNEHWYHEQFYFVVATQQIRVYTLDIDELKLAEEARIKSQEKLEENAIMLEEYASQMEQLAEQRAEQLKNAERMAAIGQTAGMVGHDIRNPLQAITSDMYLITEELKTMSDGEGKKAILESIDSVTENLSYINKIVSDLQDYTRPLKPSIQEVNLSELIEGTLLSVNVPNRISVSTNVTENSYAIKTDVAYLRRILTNLTTNAIQAMPNQGKLTINAQRKKDKVVISVQDTGVGIPEHVKTKMFTPLFTTKSKGQGLGLAVVKRLIEALNGTITFESVENQGTKFTLELSQPE